MAEKQPQAAFSALMKSLQCEWQFLQRVIPDCGSLLIPLDVVLTSVFLQVVFGSEVIPTEHLLFSLPVRFGGLSVYQLHVVAGFCFAASRDATTVIVEALHDLQPFEVDCYKVTVLCAQKEYVNKTDLRNNELFRDVISHD